jgi:hypothetical protein
MKLRVVAAAAVLMGGVTGVSATTLVGAGFTVDYTLVDQGMFADASSLPDVLGGNDLRWRPNDFFASSDGSPVSSTAKVTITAAAGYDLSSFTLTETGVFLTGVYGAGSFAASVTGTAMVTLILPSGGSQSMPADTGALPDSGLDAMPWAVSPVVFTVGAGSKQISFELTNTLSATKTGDAYAELQKTQADLIVGVTAVPEPETYALMLAGLGALGFLSRRMRRD